MRAIEWSVCDEPLDRTFLAYTPFRTTSFLKAKTLLFVEDLHEMWIFFSEKGARSGLLPP